MSNAIPFRVRLRMALRGWVYLVWLLLIPAVLMLLPADRTRFVASGVVSTQAETLAAIENARIQSIDVTVGQHVKKGDVLMRLLPASTTLDAGTYEIRLRTLTEDARRREQALVSRVADAKRDLKAVEVETATVKMDQSRDEAALAGFRAEEARLAPLVASKMLPTTELSRIRPEIVTLEETLKRYPALLTALEQNRAAAEIALKEVEDELAQERAYAQDSSQRVASTGEKRLQEVRESGAETLTASFDGIVSHIHGSAGDVVLAGLPVIRITREEPMQVTVFALPHQMVLMDVGTPVQVYARHRKGKIIPCPAVVSAMEPEMLDLADPFNPVPEYPLRGRRIYLTLQGPNDFIPGEAVNVDLPQPTLREKLQGFWSKVTYRAGF